jgi:hypothetical protein
MPDLEVLVEGNQRIVRASFRVPDENGTLTDPTTVTYTARKRREKGDSAAAYAPTEYVYLTDPEATREALGIFRLTFEPAEGTWDVYVKGTGAAHAAGEIQFVVDRAEALVP